jgi:hypothetical protein
MEGAAMKALALFALFFLPLNTRAGESLVGRWAFFMKIYQGQEMPQGPLDTLRLRFEFQQDGQSRLYWWHEGEGDHCARRGRYRVEGDSLVDRVEWVDPSNSYGCGDDTDMQVGRATRTPFRFRNGNLELRLPFGEEELIYAWKKTTMEEK